MPSEKLTRILLARSPFSPEQIVDMTETEGWNWVYGHATPHKEKLPSICFTGFSQSDKDSLATLAISAHLRVVESVNKSLLLLCAGDNAGTAKLAKAREHGIAILSRSEFVDFLETGEIPV